MTWRGVRRAARDLASAWLDAEPEEISVEISVAAPDDVVQLIRDSDKAEADIVQWLVAPEALPFAARLHTHSATRAIRWRLQPQ